MDKPSRHSVSQLTCRPECIETIRKLPSCPGTLSRTRRPECPVPSIYPSRVTALRLCFVPRLVCFNAFTNVIIECATLYRRMPTPAKEPSNGLPNTIARMQQTLQNLRGCANKMKESGRSSVKQRMELSERAMHAYRELKELTTV